MPREKIVRRRLASGEVREYRYPERRYEPRTVGAIVEKYRRPPEYTKLAPSTKKDYLGVLGKFEEVLHVPIVDVRRRHILGMRDSYADRLGLANSIISIWSILLKFVVDREYVLANPAAGVERLPLGEWERWPDRAVDFALAHFKEPMRRAAVLALYTGQRSSDLIKMRWDDYDGTAIQVTQKKTGTRLWVPCHADLKAELTEWKRNATSVTILVNPASEQPWNRIGFSNAVRLAIKAHPELKGYVFHGLRKASASLLAEAGCSALEIAAITGHMSLKNLEIYTRQADQRQRANAAIAKLENYRRKT